MRLHVLLRYARMHRTSTRRKNKRTMRRRCDWRTWHAHGAAQQPRRMIIDVGTTLHARARERLYLTYTRQGPGRGRSPLLHNIEAGPTARHVVVRREEPPKRGPVGGPAGGESKAHRWGHAGPKPSQQPPDKAPMGFVSARSLLP